MLDGVDADGAFGEGGGALDGLDLGDTGVDEGLVGEVDTRRNLKPWPSGAGLRVRVTFSPVWREVPSRVASDASVCSMWDMRGVLDWRGVLKRDFMREVSMKNRGTNEILRCPQGVRGLAGGGETSAPLIMHPTGKS